MARYHREPGDHGAGRDYTLPALDCCAVSRCWQRPDRDGRWPGLCARHAELLRPAEGACAWWRCPQPPAEDGLCNYHHKVAIALTTPADAAERAEILRAVVEPPRSLSGKGRRQGRADAKDYAERRARWRRRLHLA